LIVGGGKNEEKGNKKMKTAPVQDKEAAEDQQFRGEQYVEE